MTPQDEGEGKGGGSDSGKDRDEGPPAAAQEVRSALKAGLPNTTSPTQQNPAGVGTWGWADHPSRTLSCLPGHSPGGSKGRRSYLKAHFHPQPCPWGGVGGADTSLPSPSELRPQNALIPVCKATSALLTSGTPDTDSRLHPKSHALSCPAPLPSGLRRIKEKRGPKASRTLPGLPKSKSHPPPPPSRFLFVEKRLRSPRPSLSPKEQIQAVNH